MQLRNIKRYESREHKNRSENKCHVICVCCGLGFPNGMAPTSRIRMVGKALVAEGCRFTVLNIGGGPYPNSTSRGIVDGIEFEYLPGPTVRPDNLWKRYFLYIKGILQACIKLYKLRKKEKNLCIYSWFSGGRFVLFHRYLRAIGYPVIQEINEWWPEANRRLAWNKSIKILQGTMAISRPIIDRIKSLPSYTLKHLILHIPILIDPDEWLSDENRNLDTQQTPYVLWCGNIDCSIEDIAFLLHVSKIVNEAKMCRIVLVGKISNSSRKQIHELARKVGLNESMLELTGFVSDAELKILMNNAVALLLPLWETVRSICRFPTKLGHYLSSATPVVATALGDLTNYLKDGNSACMVSPNDVNMFADKITFLLRNKEQGQSIGLAGRHAAIQHFSIQANKTKLAQFFAEVARKHD